MSDSGAAAGPRIERNQSRAVFSQLVTGALARSPLEPSPMVVAYLVELLDGRVRQPEGVEEATLAEELLTAQRDRGALRIRRMRDLGDRALFVSGFFGDCLARKVVDIDYYEQIGRAAYSDIAAGLSDSAAGWTRLYRQLARRFGDFVDVLADVGDSARPEQPQNLLRLYERFWLTGRERDRRRLLRSGQLAPSPPAGRRGKTWPQ